MAFSKMKRVQAKTDFFEPSTTPVHIVCRSVQVSEGRDLILEDVQYKLDKQLGIKL